MVELFPNLYRPASTTRHPPHETAHAIETVGRVQTTLPAMMHFLEPQFEGVGRGWQVGQYLALISPQEVLLRLPV